MSVPFDITYAALWLLVLVNSLILLGLIRLVAQLRPQSPLRENGGREDDGRLKPGQKVPPFSAVDLAGAPIRSADYAGRPWALLFVSPTCHACTTTLAELEAIAHKVQGNVVVICRAGHDDCARLADTPKLAVRQVVDGDNEISQLFGVSSNPTAVLIDEHGRVQKYGYPQREELAELLGDGRVAQISGVG